MAIISVIVAVAANGVIGGENKLLWHIRDDLKRFKQLTTGHTIIMGRKTFESLPSGALPNRTNVVITRDSHYKAPGAVVVHSVEAALQAVDPAELCYVIGGGTIYEQMLPLATRLYITEVHKDFEGDTFFPTIDVTQWQEEQREVCGPDLRSGLTWDFVDYCRK